MKKSTLILITILCWNTTQASSPDSMYIHTNTKLGTNTLPIAILDIDSIVYYSELSNDTILEMDIPPIEYGSVTDIDGNQYKTVTIGEQEWMAENFKATRYPNGDTIPYVKNSSDWAMLEWNDTTDAYYNYTKYGYLYTHGAAIADNWDKDNSYQQGICPNGWHLPSVDDWYHLFYTIQELGFETNNADALKAKTGWSNDGNGTDNFGFGAQPGGYRRYNVGTTSGSGDFGEWWTSTETDVDGSRYISIRNSDTKISSSRYTRSKASGLSVRCLKNDDFFDFFYDEEFLEMNGFTAPKIITLSASRLTTHSATFTGEVKNNGGIDITNCGFCYSTSPELSNTTNAESINRGAREFEVNVKDLLENTRYYCTAYAINAIDTSYGATITFKTKKPIIYGNINDIQDQTYRTVQIGSQTWMAENLKSTKYNNGDSIPLIIDRDEWASLNTPACCWHSNDKEGNGNIFGVFYNSYAVKTDNLCPSGWHVSTAEDWEILIEHAGGMSIAGGKLKEADQSHWGGQNVGATDEFGFTALPAGSRGKNGAFGNTLWSGQWWSNSERGMVEWSMSANNAEITRSDQDYQQYKSGRTIRCVKD